VEGILSSSRLKNGEVKSGWDFFFSDLREVTLQRAGVDRRGEHATLRARGESVTFRLLQRQDVSFRFPAIASRSIFQNYNFDLSRYAFIFFDRAKETEIYILFWLWNEATAHILDKQKI